METPLRIVQETSKSIINWESFSIGSSEKTIFEMTGSNAASLNRVTGGGASAIDGLLQANGHVWVINPNGIIVGPNGRIDASGAVLSTLDIDDNNFLHGGDFHFTGGSTASIVNYGKVQTADKGEIFVVAHQIQNEGYLGAPDGRVILAGGSDVLIEAGPNGNVFVSSAVAGGAHVLQGANGVVEAAEVQLHAHNGNALGMAVQVLGTVRARTAANVGGKVVLSATGGAGVNVAPGSVVDASGVTGGSISLYSDGGIHIGSQVRANGESGAGSIDMFGSTVEILPTAIVEATGEIGGRIRIGSDGSDGNTVAQSVTMLAGSSVSADGTVEGGAVSVATAGELLAAGIVSANGGTGSGGSVNFAGRDIMIPEGGLVGASGEGGGNIGINGSNNVFVNGSVIAEGGSGSGGNIIATAGNNLLVNETGIARANGANGGSISLSAVDELFIAGVVEANGSDGSGGDISFGGKDITVAATAMVSANGSDGGGMINVAGSDSVNIFGTLSATGGDGAGGTITLSSTDILVGPTALIDAGGASGGIINIAASDTAEIFGVVQAIGSDGAGGTIGISGTDVLIGATAVVDAGGATGGTILVDASNQADISGTLRATGSDGRGGLIGVTGQTININSTAVIDGSGSAGGGQVFVGGGVGGNDSRFRNANKVTVAPGAQISANATESGNGGVIAFWSDGDMSYAGGAQANGAGQVGNGGFVEVSGLGNLSLGGSVSTGAAGSGRAGTFLIDPVNVDIDAAAAGLITGALATSNVIIHTSPIGIVDPGQNGDITIQNQVHVDYNSVNSLSFFAHGDFIVDRSASIRNGGSGNINVLAGWDPGALDLATLFNQAPIAQSHVDNPAPPAGGHVGSISAQDILAGTFGAFGAGGAGEVRFVANTDPDTTSVIGSAHGETNVFGGSLIMETGNDREGSQIGWNTLTNENRTTGGVVNPQLLNQDQTNFTVGNRSIYGYDAADTTVDFVGGGTLPGIGDTLSFGGHGTVYTVTAVDGSTITLDDVGGGGGGLTAAVTSGEAYTILTGAGTNGTTANEGRNNANAGNINVHTTGLLHMQGGRRSGVQIGHGGNVRSWQPNQEGDLNGDITVRAGNMIMQSGTERFGARVGHGGTNDSWGGNQPVQTINRTGDIDVESVGGVLMAAGTRKAHVAIGHGGQRIHGNVSGDIRVVGQNGGVIMQAPQVPGDNRESWIMIGNGGYDFQGNASGDITVQGTSIVMRASSQSRDNFVMIGNGGRSVRGEHFGHISVEATAGSITGIGGFGFGQTDLERNFIQIGNGGYDGDHVNGRPQENPLGPNGAGTTVGEGMTTVDVLNAQNAAEGGRNDDITAMTEASPFLQGALGIDVHRRVGSAGNISVIAAGGINLRAGGDADSHAQIGHGGRDSFGAHGTWDIDNADGDNDWYTGQDGDITVIANNGGVILDRSIIHGSTTGERSHVQIGHGGYFSTAGAQGNIRVEAHNGNVEANGGSQDDAYAMIGHGGRSQSWGNGDTTDTAAFRHARSKHDTSAAGVLHGDIDVLATGSVIFRSGFGEADRAWSQVGHGGFGVYAPPHLGHNGDINVQAGGSVDFYAGRRNNPDHELGQDALLNGMLDRTESGNGVSDNWTAIGHVTRDRGHSNFFGDITVDAGTNPFAGTASLGADIAATPNAFVSVEATGGWDGLGYEDDQANNTRPGDYPTFNTGRNSSLTGDRNFAMIGHGGWDFDQNNQGDDRGRSGSNSIGVGALGYWWDDVTGQHVAPTIIGTLDDGSTAGSVAGDRIADVTGDNNAHDINGNDNLRPDQGGYVDDNIRGRGWVIPNVGLAPRLLDPNNAADAALISTSDINVTATGDVRVVGAQFDPTNAMRRNYVEDGTRNVGTIAIGTAGSTAGDGNPTWDADDVATLFSTTRDLTTDSSVFTTQTTAAVPLNLVQSARDGFAKIGHGGIASGQRAFGPNNSGLEAGYGYFGDINVTAGGEVKVLAGNFIRELADGEAPDLITGTTQYDFDDDGLGALPLYRPGEIAGLGGQIIGATGSSTSLNNVTQGSVGTDDLFAMIGHGGQEFSSHVRGNISVTSTGGGLEVKAGNSIRSWAQVGHGGEAWNVGHESRINVPQDIQGTVSIDVTGDISVTGGQTTFSYAQIGHGGVEFRDDDDPNTARGDGRNNFDVDSFNVTNADISVISRMGNISLANRSFLDPNGFFAQPQWRDNAINNTAGDFLELENTTFQQDGLAHTIIGHGSYDSEVNVGELVDGVFIGGNINVRAEQGNVTIGAVTNTTGLSAAAPMHWRSPMQIGHLMNHSDRTPPNTTLSLLGNIDVYAGGDVTLRAGDSPRVLADIQQLGSYGNRDGIQIYQGFDISRFDAFSFDQADPSIIAGLYYPQDIDTREFDSYAKIGHGGNTNGSWDGRATMVTAGDINVTANRNAAAVDDPLTPLVDETVAAKIILDAGDGTGAQAMIGHGGRLIRHFGGATGDITVNASGDINMYGGERFLNGTIAGPNLRTENKGNWASIGHNIQSVNELTGNAEGDIIVNAGGDLLMQAGFGDSAHVRIGNGSNINFAAQRHSGNFLGDISVTVGGDLTMRGGDLNNDGSRVGFSEQENWPGLAGLGEDAVEAELGSNSVLIPAISYPDDTYAQIGNGGNGVNGVMQGNITVQAGNDVRIERGNGLVTLFTGIGPFIEGAAIGGGAKIGHGDWLFDAPATGGTLTREGNIVVAAGNNMDIVGSMIGHTDARISAAIPIAGSTTVTTGRAGTGGTLTIDSSVHRIGQADPIGANPTQATLADTGLGVSVITSALGGELRFYLPEHNPTTDHLAITAGTLFNGSAYVPHAAEAMAPFRADETLQPEAGYTFTNPGGSFLNDLPNVPLTPLGLYPAHGFGDYHVYFGNTPVVPGPVVGGGGGTTGGGGGGDGLLIEEPEVDLLRVVVPIVSEPIVEVGTPVIQIGLTPLQLLLIDGFNASGVQFEIGRGLQTSEEGSVGDTSAPTTDGLILFFQSGDQVFAVSGQGTFYVTASGDPYDLLPVGTLRVNDLEDLLSLRKNPSGQGADGTDGVIDAPVDPSADPNAIFDPFQMQDGDDEDDEKKKKEEDGDMFEVGEPAVNTGNTSVEGEFDF